MHVDYCNACMVVHTHLMCLKVTDQSIPDLLLLLLEISLYTVVAG